MELRNGHFPAERQQLILAEIAASGSVRVEDLGRRFDVSEMTVRRDLDALESQGLIERTHGGAVAPGELTRERRYREKDMENREAKQLIGRLAAELVSDGETVLINSGSTTRQVIAHLAGRKSVRIITNNVAAVSGLPENTQAEILLLGGRFRDASGCVVGSWAVELLKRISPSRVILGADGISLSEGLSSPIPEEAELTRQMIKRVRGPVVVAADSAKVGRVCGFHIAPISAIDILVCNGGEDSPWYRAFSGAGVKIIGSGSSGKIGPGGTSSTAGSVSGGTNAPAKAPAVGETDAAVGGTDAAVGENLAAGGTAPAAETNPAAGENNAGAESAVSEKGAAGETTVTAAAGGANPAAGENHQERKTPGNGHAPKNPPENPATAVAAGENPPKINKYSKDKKEKNNNRRLP